MKNFYRASGGIIMFFMLLGLSFGICEAIDSQLDSKSISISIDYMGLIIYAFKALISTIVVMGGLLFSLGVWLGKGIMRGLKVAKTDIQGIKETLGIVWHEHSNCGNCGYDKDRRLKDKASNPHLRLGDSTLSEE